MSCASVPGDEPHEAHLSPSEELIVGMLLHRGPMYGLAIVDAADGAIARGSVYVLLYRLEDRDYVACEQTGQTKRYRTTAHGRDAYHAYVARRDAIVRGAVAS